MAHCTVTLCQQHRLLPAFSLTSQVQDCSSVSLFSFYEIEKGKKRKANSPGALEGMLYFLFSMQNKMNQFFMQVSTSSSQHTSYQKQVCSTAASSPFTQGKKVFSALLSGEESGLYFIYIQLHSSASCQTLLGSTRMCK